MWHSPTWRDAAERTVAPPAPVPKNWHSDIPPNSYTHSVGEVKYNETRLHPWGRINGHPIPFRTACGMHNHPAVAMTPLADQRWAGQIIRWAAVERLGIAPDGTEYFNMRDLHFLLKENGGMLTKVQLDHGRHYAQHEGWITNHIKAGHPGGFKGGALMWLPLSDATRETLLHANYAK